MIRARVEVGRDVHVVSETAEDIELTGRVRLHPGRPVEVITRPGGAPLTKRGVVYSWRVAKLGTTGPIYHGRCRWE